MSRPSIFTEELGDEIADRLAQGESMRLVCADEEMPNRRTVERWMAADKGFAAKCARAREWQADMMDEMILDVAAKATPETANADRVKLDAYKWRAGRLNPKVYGDKTLHTGADGEGPVAFVLVGRSESTSDDEWQARNG